MNSKYKFGIQISEDEYRKLRHPSYSLLSDIKKDGPFAVSRPRADISLNEPIIIGKMVDSYITEGKPPSDNLYIIDKIPTDKALSICQDLMQLQPFLPNPTNILSKENEKDIAEICDKYDYYKTFKTRLAYLSKYKKFIEVYSKDHKVKPFIISSYQKQVADKVITAVRTTYPSFNNLKCLGQVKLLGVINGVTVKVMFDMIYVDEKNKKLIPFDLKTGMESYNDFIDAFIKWNYYIQSSLYKEVLLQNLKGTPFEDYEVLSFRFLYCSKVEALPMVYRVSDDWHQKGLNGFNVGNTTHRGVYDLIEDFKYYSENPTAVYRKEYIKINPINGKASLEIDIPQLE